MKHAYLILAHNEPKLLQRLVSALDDARNDIFVHVDAKVAQLPMLSTEHAGLRMTSRRVDVHWGDLSMMEAEFVLFEEALASGHHDYYHLLSGVDFPLRSQDAIDAFFNENIGREFIGFSSIPEKELDRKMRRYHLFPKYFRDEALPRRIIRSGFLRLQELFGIKRNRDIVFRKGSQWVSVTESFARYFLSKEKWVRKVFNHTFCCDETVMQTLAWNSQFKASIYDTELDGVGCVRKIGWNTQGCLVPWTRGDFDELMGSNALFARKFSSGDTVILDMIRDSFDNES